MNYSGTRYAGNAAENGGSGGSGYAARANSSWGARSAGGGAGNPGGVGAISGSIARIDGETGTGGLLILYASKVKNTGKVTSDGSVGGAAMAWAGGGSSGRWKYKYFL